MIADFETEVSIYCDDILEYVRDNWDWFRENLGGIAINEDIKALSNILDKYNNVRIDRDNGVNNDAVKLYNDLESVIRSLK